MSSEEEQDACNVCDGDRSTSKNPIMFCDGRGCNMPVHKRCVNLDKVPEGDWFCQRCENRKKKKATPMVCCLTQVGAVKKTNLPEKYMHIVCALWNKNVDNTKEPYVVPEDQLNLYECYFCSQKKGLCIKCEEPSCTTAFHATCAINNSIITPAAHVPSNFSPRCVQHQIKAIKSKSTPQKKGRRLRKSKKIIDSDEESEEEEDSDEDDEDDDDDDDDDEMSELEEEEDEDEEEEEDSEDDGKMGRHKKSASKTGAAASTVTSTTAKPKLAIGSKPSVPLPSKKEVPAKRRASPSSLFPEDQQSSDDSDDDMGTSSKPRSKSSGSAFSHSSNTPRPEESFSYRERLEAKRKKSGLESRSGLLDDKKSVLPTSTTATATAAATTISSSSPPVSSVPPKQKLPNKAHLSNNASLMNGGNGNGIRPSITPPIKKFSGPNVIKDIDEIQNDIRAGAQRWNNSSMTPLQHPQPTTPHAVSTTFFENDAMKSQQQPRKSMDNWKLNNNERDELNRLREEVRKLADFKRSVSEVLSGLNVPIPSGINPNVDVDSYVFQLQAVMRRTGPVREDERVHLQECVKGVMNNQ